MSLTALQHEFRHWLTREPVETIDGVGEAGRAGLAVYRNNYRGALAECLANNFATTRMWLGDDAFDQVVRTHIATNPPHSWTLDAYTSGFPDTAAALYPDDLEVGELARLERDLGVIFTGVDAEPLMLADLARIDWERALLRFIPTFTLLSLRSNASSIWSAIQANRSPPAASVLAEPLHLALWRKQFAATFRALEPLEMRGIAMLRDGKPFADLCALLAAELGEDQGVQLAGRFLGQWVNDGMMDSNIS